MAWIGELLTAAGPWAGWVISGLLGTGALWLYSTDRLVSRGRHTEQADHYEHLLETRDAHHRQTLEELRRHFTEMLRVAEERSESYRDDRDYWREVGLDLMNAVAATVSRKDTDGAS